MGRIMSGEINQQFVNSKEKWSRNFPPTNNAGCDAAELEDNLSGKGLEGNYGGAGQIIVTGRHHRHCPAG